MQNYLHRRLCMPSHIPPANRSTATSRQLLYSRTHCVFLFRNREREQYIAHYMPLGKYIFALMQRAQDKCSLSCTSARGQTDGKRENSIKSDGIPIVPNVHTRGGESCENRPSTFHSRRFVALQCQKFSLHSLRAALRVSENGWVCIG